jgi:hypothetical protein
MQKTVLVVGDITRRQYAAARFEIARKGHSIKTVYLTPQQFVLPDEHFADDNGDIARDAVTKSAKQHGEVAAIVMIEAIWDLWSYQQCDLIRSAFDDLYPELTTWVVRTTGMVEYMG